MPNDKKTNKMSDLRDHLFDTLAALKDPSKPLDVERAKAICNVAGKLIDSAKVEVQYAQVLGAKPDYEFFEDPRRGKPALTEGEKPGKPNGHAAKQ